MAEVLDQAYELVPLADVSPHPDNPRRGDVDAIRGSVAANGFYGALVVQRSTGRILAGNHRYVAARSAGVDALPVLYVDVDDDRARRILLADNRTNDVAGYDDAALLALLAEVEAVDPELAGTGFDVDALAALRQAADDAAGGGSGAGGARGSGHVPLADRYGVPPFSVLDARSGAWQDRKREWLALGIESEIGRGENLIYSESALIGADPGFYTGKAKTEQRIGRSLTTREYVDGYYELPANAMSSTSVFDPVLCEVAYRWFAPPGGGVLDPFAGGSVRGLVAAALGRRYTGVDLADAQVEANREQAQRIVPGLDVDDAPVPVWHVGDARHPGAVLDDDAAFDLVFSCPPYADLERYSDDPADLSTLGYGDFRTAHAEVIAAAVARLRPDRFAVWVVGEARAKTGHGAYYGLVPDTITAFRDAGCDFYGEAILVTAVGSLPLRTGSQFEASRKLGKTHQNVLIFVKGDAKAAAAACGPPPTVALPDDTHPTPDYMPEVTPVERHGDVWVKRDDAWTYRGASGAKARAMIHAAREAGAAGVLSAGARMSPQLERAALAAAALGVPCRVHTGAGAETEETATAVAAGADVVRHKPGRLSVIRARYRADAEDSRFADWLRVPFGMEHPVYLAEVAEQAAALDTAAGYGRIVVPTGSGMTLAGILAGLDRAGNPLPVVAVLVGSDPTTRLDEYAPGWRARVDVVQAGVPYEARAANRLGDLTLDPVYEAKCLEYLRPDDLLWAVGCRASAAERGGAHPSG